MAFQMRLIPGKLPKGLIGNAPKNILREETLRTANAMAQIVFNAVRKVSPIGATGTLKRGWNRVLARMIGKNAVAVVVATGAAGLEANVWENGAQPHFPPVSPGGEPALGAWIRNKLPRVTSPFVVEGGKRRPADLSNPKDVESIAFSISQAINRRGFPRPGLKPNLFTRAILRIRPALQVALNSMAPRVRARIAGVG